MSDLLDRVLHESAGRRLALFLDYDGTLTPIVERPEEAVLAEGTRAVLRALSRQCTLAVVSGRDLEDVRSRVAIPELVYAGSHGFDIEAPGVRHEHPDARTGAAALPQVQCEIERGTAAISGVQLERKRFALAVHYRRVNDTEVPAVRAAVDRALARHETLRVSEGKKVFDLQPDVPWDKGRAVLWLLEKLGLDGPDVIPLYIGDDVTDEDAFRAVADRGLTIAVQETPRATAAQFTVHGTEAVCGFLAALAPALENRGWVLEYSGFRPEEERLREALCTLGNGYFATRGAAPESSAGEYHYPGTYVAGLYDRLGSEIAGRVVTNEDLVNCPNWLPVAFRVGEGEWFDLKAVEVLEYRQALDVRRGVLERTVRFRDAAGRHTRLAQRRLVHLSSPHLAALETVITAEDWDGVVEVQGALDGTVVNAGVARYRALESRHLEAVEQSVDEGMLFLKVRTVQSHVEIALAARTRLESAHQRERVAVRERIEPGYVAQHWRVEIARGETLHIAKTVALYTSRDRAISECGEAAREAVRRAPELEVLFTEQALAWEQLWRRFEIGLEQQGGNGRTALVLRLHIFHLLQTVSPNTIDMDAGVPARGWHGEAYRGHVFWDELFIFPLLNMRLPEITRALLIYRYRRLDEARENACTAGYRGAMYPWQSGSSGREESQIVHLNPVSGRWIPDHTFLQRHVNSAIAYNVWQYYQATRDLEFLSFHGAEMLLEIARFWASFATFNGELGRYEIRGVVGPDEFHTLDPATGEPGLSNHSYTNLMAVWVLCRAFDVLERLPDERRVELRESLAITDEELARWEDVSRRMRLVFHGEGVMSQFEGYERLAELDWAAYRAEHEDIQRLDRILEAEGDDVNRYRVSKQADVLMLFYVFSSEELAELFARLGYPYDAQTIPRNIAYYAPRTSHGSTLSRIVDSWVLARSDRAGSWRVFLEALESDVADIQGGTTAEGIHLGAMAGTVDLIQRGYTGIVVREGVLWFNPRLPDGLRCLSMTLRYRGHALDVRVTHDALEIHARPSNATAVKLGVVDAVHTLEAGESHRFELQGR